MWKFLRDLDNFQGRRRARRQWRDFRVILFLVLLFVLCNVFTCIGGAAVYNLQRLGLLPTTAPTPTGLYPTITMTPPEPQPTFTPTPER